HHPHNTQAETCPVEDTEGCGRYSQP
ncbi:hypothetical protein BN1723_019381, partial [Verticillium longisporum]